MRLIRWFLRLPLSGLWTVIGISVIVIRAVGAALLLLAGALVGLAAAILRSDRFTRRHVVDAIVRGLIIPLPLVGALALMLGGTLGVALATAAGLVRYEDLLLPMLRQILVRHAVPVLIALVVLGQSGLTLAARLAEMTASGEADTLRTLGIAPARWVLPYALLEFLLQGAAQFIWAAFVAQLAAALVLQIAIGIPAGHYADALTEVAARADVWDGLARSVAYGLIAWIAATTAGGSVGPGPDRIARAAVRGFVATLLGVLTVAAVFTYLGR